MRRRQAAIAIAAALAAIVLFLLARGSRDDAGEQVRTAAVATPPAAPATRERAAPPVAAVGRPAARAPAAPVFDLVRVEKDEVCEGEENLVTVHAHTTDDNDAFLQYTIAGEAGAQVPVRSFIGRDGKPVPQYAVAFSRDNVATRIELPAFRVKSCRPERVLVVAMRMLPNSAGEREFSATIQTVQGPPFTPAWFEWSFGDGSFLVTPGPTAAHDYSALPQKTAFTDLLVVVKARDGSGESVEGRYPLHIRNVAFHSRQRGIVTIFAEPTPRFPSPGAGGIVRQTFRLWHAEDVTVRISGATMARLTLPAASGGAPDPPRRVALDPERLWRAREIPPRTAIEEAMQYDFGADPAAYGVVYEIQGGTDDGMQARGEIAILRPQPRPTRDNSVPIDDPALAAKIRRAMQILNQPTVSQEDLFRLEREGKLQ